MVDLLQLGGEVAEPIQRRIGLERLPRVGHQRVRPCLLVHRHRTAKVADLPLHLVRGGVQRVARLGQLAQPPVIAEDLFLLREGLSSLLKQYGFEVAEAVDNGPDLLEALTEHQPDVAIVDVRLPPTHTDEGLRAALEARRRTPGLPILILSAHVEQLYARELLADQAGGVGYLLKDRVFTDEQFTDALYTVARGGTVMDPEVVAKLLAKRPSQMTRLSEREREVLALMAEGRSNSAIAQRLFITDKAVSKHCTSIFAKLNLPPDEDDNRRVLAVLAYLNS